MRCIEIMMIFEQLYKRGKININMRCIEILIFPPIFKKYFMININMRCIEIIIRHMLYYTKPRLTLT